MTILWNVLIYGGAGSLVLSGLLLGMVWYNPRLMLQDYAMHLRGFLIGTALSAVVSLLIALAVILL